MTGPTIFSQSSAASLVNSLIPSSLPAAAAAAVANNLTARLFTIDGPGNVQSDIQSDLDADATYLSELGETGTYDVSLLMAFEVEMATDFGAVEQENTPGIFGLGVPDPTLTALTDSAGNVTIVEGGVGIIGYFTLESDGSYQAAPGVSNTLTLSNGVYQDRLADGTDVVFNANGSLNFIEQPNGDTLTAGYTGDLLTTLTDSFTGDVTSFAYGSQGLVTKYTDPQGRVATFTYDANERLVSTTSSQGTTSFTYVNGSDPASENAIATITNPDGTQQDFTYDSQGRVIEETLNNTAEPITTSYNEGEFIQTDALGDTTTNFLNEFVAGEGDRRAWRRHRDGLQLGRIADDPGIVERKDLKLRVRRSR